ncbi:MAG: hypothetical protein K0R18_2613, partial [Bacillales bacterium]|nr:hypothetical protein [Bacillales bacterium]
MSATINFIKNSLSNKTLEIKRRAPVAATLKYSIKANLPASEENNVLIYTDDAELFFGSGSGKL